MSISERTRGSKTPSSILKKNTSLKKRLSEITQTPSKVRFVLPHSKKVQKILEQFVAENDIKDYESLVCLIRDADLLDSDISSLLNEATECISLLNRDLRLFVEALLSVNWIDRDNIVVKQYQSFIVNLLSAHNYHSKFVIDKLVSLFLPNISDPEWPDGIATDLDCSKLHNVHVLLNYLLTVVPMCKELLFQSVSKQFPYYNKPTHVQEYYLHNLLWILVYQPTFRPDVFHLIFTKLIIMDVNAPKEEIEKARLQEEEEIFQMDDDNKSLRSSAKTAYTVVNRNSVAHSLDVCMDKMFNYIASECINDKTNELDWEKTKRLYQDLLTVFDKVLLPTYNAHHVQFIMFVMAGLKDSVAEAYLNYLWKKVCNPNVAPVLRQAAVTYIASLVARGTFINLPLIKNTLQQMAEWIHSYISNQDGLDCVNSDVRIHAVFYSVCQALFYVIAFRHKDLTARKKHMIFLESLNLTKIVTCRLNPLRVCQPAVVQNFAAVTRLYQLAYCYSVIDHNLRNVMPTIYQDDKGSTIVSDNVLGDYYPFDPYVLERSGSKIHPMYKEYQETFEESMETEVKETGELDDFLYSSHDISSTPKNSFKFSYGSSPGFKFK